MVAELLLLQLIWLLLPSSALIAKPGCQQRCGNMYVPYPFGIGPRCYREGFAIICDDSYDPPKAFLDINKAEVLDISLDDGQILINNKIYSECYDNSGKIANNTPVTIDFSKTPYTFSRTSNKLMVISCDTIAALVRDSTGGGTVSGCVSGVCDQRNISFPRSCSGVNISCCDTSIQKGLKRFDVEVYNWKNVTKRGDLSPCSYAFLLDQGYSIKVGRGLYEYREGRAPVTLDWVIGNVTCEEARRNSTTYACGLNTQCHNDAYNGPGYDCHCDGGYGGNPYLADGCQACGEDEMDEYARMSCIHVPSMDNAIIIRTYITLGGLGVGIALLLLAFGGIRLYKSLMKRKQIKLKEKFFKQNGGLLLQQKIHSRDGSVEQSKIFVAEELDRATDNYNKNRILGQGASGTVYKGMLQDGTIIAVKKSKTVVEGQIEQFINEVAILSQINHRNVVKLLGCCLETEVPLLVYEFISNGTLFHHIHETVQKSSMSWENRLRIATEIAGALAYMHSTASIPIFHRDIKSSNILLDNECIAKVSDFGISRSISGDQTHLTTAVQGTFGYLDPEYYYTGQFTDKSDVYSFGIVLAELLIGEKPISLERSENFRSLAVYFISAMKENRLYQIMEDRIVKEGEKKQVLAVAEVAKACLQQNGKKRPTMKEVAIELEGLRRSHRYPWVQENQEEVDHFGHDPSYLSSGSLIGHDSFGGSASNSTFERQKVFSLEIE